MQREQIENQGSDVTRLPVEGEFEEVELEGDLDLPTTEPGMTLSNMDGDRDGGGVEGDD